MSTVFVDGEKVEFEGEAPESCQSVCELIQTFLGNQGKLVSSVEVDGKEIALEEASGIEAYETLAFVSISLSQHLIDMCRTWGAVCDELVGNGRGYARSCLRQRWDETQSEVVNYLEGFRPLIEGLGILQNFGSESEAAWRDDFGASFENAVGKIGVLANAIEARSVVRVSDLLAKDFVESWSRLGVVLNEKVIVQLELQQES